MEDLNITRSSFPSAPAERGGVDGGAPRARAGQAVQGHLARPARGGPRHRRREGRGRVAPARQHAPARSSSPTSRPSSSSSRAPPPGRPQTGTDLQRADQHELDRPEGGLGRDLPPPLRRLDGGLLDRRARGRSRIPHFGRKDNLDKALKAILAAKNGDPMTGGSASDPSARSPRSRTSPCRSSTWRRSRPSSSSSAASRTTNRSRARSCSTSRTRRAACSRTSPTRTPTC